MLMSDTTVSIKLTAAIPPVSEAIMDAAANGIVPAAAAPLDTSNFVSKKNGNKLIVLAMIKPEVKDNKRMNNVLRFVK